MAFLEYLLEADTLYLGERPKGGIFKPCIRTIPFSQITGALNRYFGRHDFKAAGYLEKDGHHNQMRYLTYSPRSRLTNLSKIPIQVEFLTNVLARIFILANEASLSLPNKFILPMGGLRSRGFGTCKLSFITKHKSWNPTYGRLVIRIPLSETASFALKEIRVPQFGYLFQPKPGTYSGVYVKSLFEGSEVVGPPFLIKPIK